MPAWKGRKKKKILDEPCNFVVDRLLLPAELQIEVLFVGFLSLLLYRHQTDSRAFSWLYSVGRLFLFSQQRKKERERKNMSLLQFFYLVLGWGLVLLPTYMDILFRFSCFIIRTAYTTFRVGLNVPPFSNLWDSSRSIGIVESNDDGCWHCWGFCGHLSTGSSIPLGRDRDFFPFFNGNIIGL